MSCRRPTNTKKRTRSGRMIEQLESRLLLYTVTGSGAFEFRDGSSGGNNIRVSFQNVTAEFVFIDVNATNQVPLVPAEGGDLKSDFIPAGATGKGRDLYHIFVKEAGADSFIAIAKINEKGIMTPFAGNVTLRVASPTGKVGPISTDSGTGDAFLGGRTVGTDPVDERPIINHVFHGMGLIPNPRNGHLVAGLSVAAGQNLGRFMFGGTVTGAVNIGGSMEAFYAGALLTGSTYGQSLGDNSIAAGGPAPDWEPSVPNNFYVAGDLRHLLVKGSIGTDTTASDKPLYLT